MPFHDRSCDFNCKSISSRPRTDGGRAEKLEKVRAGLDAARVKRTASKRFMTPERKKKLRVLIRHYSRTYVVCQNCTMCCNCDYIFIGNIQVLLRKEAAKKLKEETDAAMAERRKVIEKRVGQPKKLEGLSDGNYHNSSYILIMTFLTYTFSYRMLA